MADIPGGYLTIPGIRGTSMNPKHRNSIEFLSFSFPPGASRQKISFVKPTDSSSPLLFNAISSGTLFDSVAMEWWSRHVDYSPDSDRFGFSPASAPATSLDFLKLTMTGVTIVNFQPSENNLDAFLIDFSEMKRTYGTIPLPQDTVRPRHQHLINRIVSGGKQP
jgi:type VI protein secretion system component Hcp